MAFGIPVMLMLVGGPSGAPACSAKTRLSVTSWKQPRSTTNFCSANSPPREEQSAGRVLVDKVAATFKRSPFRHGATDRRHGGCARANLWWRPVRSCGIGAVHHPPRRPDRLDLRQERRGRGRYPTAIGRSRPCAPDRLDRERGCPTFSSTLSPMDAGVICALPSRCKRMKAACRSPTMGSATSPRANRRAWAASSLTASLPRSGVSLRGEHHFHDDVSRLGFAVSNDAGDDQIGIVESRAEGVHKRIANSPPS